MLRVLILLKALMRKYNLGILKTDVYLFINKIPAEFRVPGNFNKSLKHHHRMLRHSILFLRKRFIFKHFNLTPNKKKYFPCA